MLNDADSYQGGGEAGDTGRPGSETRRLAIRRDNNWPMNYASGHNGIVYPSARHAAGLCVAAFSPGLIQNFQQGETWVLKWAGSPTPTITKAA
jgi:hypothetical protein